MYPANVLTHSTYVKGEQGNGGGYKALLAGSFDVKRYRKYWVIHAKNGISDINIATGNITRKWLLTIQLRILL